MLWVQQNTVGAANQGAKTPYQSFVKSDHFQNMLCH